MNLSNKIITDIMQSLVDSHLRKIYQELMVDNDNKPKYYQPDSYFSELAKHIETALGISFVERELIFQYLINEAARRWYNNIPFIETEPEYYESKMNSDD